MIDLKQFFSSMFDKQKFIQFITDRFYGFASNDKDGEYLGKVKLDDKSEIGFFIFKVEDGKDIENSRVGFHNELKFYSNDLMLDGAIGAFYNLSQNAWRLSFIRFSYDDNHKKIVSNQKRFTYILGIDEVNTPLIQFANKANTKYTTILEIQNDFSTEKVSKEFFEEYKKLFEKVNENLKPQMALFGNEETLHAFSKKLLGRIVFIYFLQKKGWLGVAKDGIWGDGNKNFLSQLYKKDSNDFYTKQLSPLFFDTLNKKRDDDYSSKFECKIPFLNGGLFDKNQRYDDSIFIDDELFGEIFEIFGRYNFTIIEDSPDESEIAIDPEMLGRVFENLLEENYRKGKGAFYTPREIVSYMCKSSVEHYLESATKEHQYIFGVNDFLNLSAMDDEKIKDFYIKHPQKYLVVNDYFADIKPYKNLVVHFRIIAKLRGFYKDSQSDTLVKAKTSGHSEISHAIWAKILKKEYTYHSHIIGSNKEIRLKNKVFIYPTIIKYVQIEEKYFALAFLPNIFGDLELNTIFQIRKSDLKRKTNKQESILKSWENKDDFAFNKTVSDDLKSLWRDCWSPHTVPHKGGEHNTAADKFSEISHKLFKVENITDKDLRKHLNLKWYDLKVNKILNNSSIIQNDLIDIMLKKIKQIKVLDPAIGSGAFPMGMLHEIVQTRLHLGDKTLYAKLKREIIENSIYGVDIDGDAVEIAKLRFWLSLTVDETIPSPLPNLDFKIMQGNSLIETINGFDIIPKDIYEVQERKFTSLFDAETPSLFDAKIFDKLTSKIHEFYNDSTGAKKQSDKEEIKHLIKEIIEKYLESQEKEYADNEKNIQSFTSQKKQLVNTMVEKMNNISQAKRVLNELIKNNFQTKELFLYKLFFGEVLKNGGFDVVIGNPPYLRIQGIDKKIAQTYKEIYSSATGSFDLYVLFTEKALSLINQGGIVNFIMPHKWVNSAFGVGLREVTKKKFFKFISFREYQVFNASTYTSLVWFANNSKEVRYVGLDKNLTTNTQLSGFLNLITDDTYTITKNEKLGNDAWTFSDNKTAKVLAKLDKQPLRVKNVFEKIFQGIATSKDSVYFLSQCIENKEMIEGYSKELDRRISIEKELVKPLLKGDDVHRYETLKTDKSVIFPYFRKIEEGKEKAELYSEKELQRLFPKGYAYLKECESVLRDRESGRLQNDEFWYRYIYPKNLTLFDKEKLIQPDISMGCNFAYDEKGDFYSTTTNYGYKKYDHIKESYKFYMAILNSKVLWWYLQQTGTTMANGFFRFKPDYINPFPLPKIATLTPHKTNIDTLLNMPKKPRYDKITKILVATVDGKDIYLTEFLFAKNRGFIEDISGHSEFDIGYFRLLPYVFMNIEEVYLNTQTGRDCYIFTDNTGKKIIHVVDDDRFLISIHANRPKEFERFKKKAVLKKSNLQGSDCAHFSILSPAGATFWRQASLIEQLYSYFSENTPVEENFIVLVDEILESKQKIKDYKILFGEAKNINNFDREIALKLELEKLENICKTNEIMIDEMVYKLYGLSEDEIKIIEGDK